MLRMEHITVKGAGTLYSATIDGLKMEKKGINALAKTEIMLIAITINYVFHILSLKSLFNNCGKYENLIDKI